MSWQKFLAGFDYHGDKHDPEVETRFLEFDAAWKPTVRIFGGDLWDFRPIRRKASEDEKRDSMTADYDAGMEFLDEWQPNVFLRGNHDERLWDAKENGTGPLQDLAGKWIDEIDEKLKKMRCLMLPWDKRKGVYLYGHLRVIHGFFAGLYATKQHASVYGSVLHGHTHAIDEAAVPGLEKRVGRACGCLCQLDYEYNRGQPNSLRHAHGWAYGVVNLRTGDYIVWQAEDINGHWIVAKDVIAL